MAVGIESPVRYCDPGQSRKSLTGAICAASSACSGAPLPFSRRSRTVEKHHFHFFFEAVARWPGGALAAYRPTGDAPPWVSVRSSQRHTVRRCSQLRPCRQCASGRTVLWRHGARASASGGRREELGGRARPSPPARLSSVALVWQLVVLEEVPHQRVSVDLEGDLARGRSRQTLRCWARRDRRPR